MTHFVLDLPRGLSLELDLDPLRGLVAARWLFCDLDFAPAPVARA